ncbi:MAG: PfkB family carbohydrate kinase [Sphaerochaeta sp.]|nr:PfkB family carbohydrate kinase [Sphaerochaeta sp.]
MEKEETMVQGALVVGLNPTFQETMEFNNYLSGEVNRATSHRLDASGKGMNVARVLSQLQIPTRLLTHLGGSRVEEFLTLAREDGVRLIWTPSGSVIRTCVTVIDHGGHLVTELVQEPHAVAASTDQMIRELYSAALEPVQWVVIPGTRAPGYSPHLYADLVQEAKGAGKSVLLDYRGRDLEESLPMGADVVKPNLSEFVATFFPDHPALGEHDESESLKRLVKGKMQHIYDSYGSKTVVSRGGDPLWAWDGSVFFEIESLNVHAVNTIGCGDAFSGGFVAAMVRGSSFEEALHNGIEAAAKNAQTLRPGALWD